jgi:hypothetical protein
MKIFGIEVGRNAITNEEYVELVRLLMRGRRLLSLVFFCLGALCFWTFVFILRQQATGPHTLFVDFQRSTSCLVMGLSWGLSGGLMACGLFESNLRILRFIAGHKTERLLLQFHEELKKQCGRIES